MKKISIFIILFELFININQANSQSSILPNTKFETVEKIRLGLTKEKFINELKFLKIQNKIFSSNIFSQKFWLEKNKEENNFINFFYTQIFNFDEYQVSKNLIEHPALIHTESVDNKTISSIVLLLGHTGKVIDYTKKDSLEGKKIEYFKQDIDQTLFFKIIDLYDLKYGQPELIQDSTSEFKYYRLFKKHVITEKAESYKNYILRWETDFFNIEIFPGFNTNAFYVPNEYYSASTNWVSSNLSDDPLQENQKPCFTFPYVRYELNQKALKLLGIDKLRI
ncbi:hypothetical protein [Daejeonella sp.]|uniref:hypothetical protein n=1 Tax=Daejeonella sp. TaxID=2805397 RepID=UPI0025C03044|nr:hypothetical protein [Daejeonella sp.]